MTQSIRSRPAPCGQLQEAWVRSSCSGSSAYRWSRPLTRESLWRYDWTDTVMPANLTPEYKAAEAAFRKARDPRERLEWQSRG